MSEADEEQLVIGKGAVIGAGKRGLLFGGIQLVDEGPISSVEA